MNSDIITKKILVVDDEEDIALTLKVGLDHEGMSCEAFSDPLQALDYFNSHSAEFYLVLSDIRMPVMSGFEFTRKVRAMKPDIKVILMTSFLIDKSEFRKLFPSTIIDNILEKPFSISQLKAILCK